jgi:hypothetical protein
MTATNQNPQPPIEATDARLALCPVVPLAQLERSIFNLTVTRNGHLKPADAVLLTAYARAAARVLRAGKSDSDADVEKRTRTMAMLARSLRLTPRGCSDPQGGRQEAAEPARRISRPARRGARGWRLSRRR